MQDPRTRGIRNLVSGSGGPIPIQWASPKQQECFSYGPLPLCASGGFGAAKTWALCLKALYLSDTFPNNRGVIARRVCKELELTTMSTFFKICPPALYAAPLGKRSDSEKYLRLRNGSEVLWLHMDNPETENVIRGLEINWFIIDQAEEVAEEIFDTLMARLGRWDKAEVPEWLLAQHGGRWDFRDPVTGRPMPPNYPMIACNPDVETHWIYRRFHPESREWQDKWRGMGYKMVQMRSDENKFLPKYNLDVMLSKDESFVRRFVRGEWGIPEGQIHAVSPLSILTTNPEDQGHPDRGIYVDGREILEYLRRSCTLHRTLDHGDAQPTCCLWWAVDREGNVIFYREYYKPNTLISDHRENITKLSEGEKYQFNLADPSIFYLTMQKYGGRWSVNDEYADCKNLPRENALFWQPADNNELGTRNRISEYLRVDPNRIHPITKEKGSPHLFLLLGSPQYPQGCEQTLRQLKSQRREKIGSESGRPIFGDDRDMAIPDHAYDCLRYAIASRPPVAVEISTRKKRGTWNDIFQKQQEFERRGGPKILAREARRLAAERMRANG
ncbi:MAG: hypothetical protein EHM23_28615 [Acidobacteria bacterium]|nr:MAG: hypothetical protein EHM23_28615 [Acidobacteriota bacterium]